GDSLIRAEAWRVAGNLYGKQNNYKNAFDWLGKAIVLSRSLTSDKARQILARSLLNLGALYHQNGDFNLALSGYLEAEKIFFELNDVSWLIRTYASLGDLYDKIVQPEKRKEVNEKAFSLVSETDDPQALIKAYTCEANNLSNAGNFNDAMKYYEKTVVLAQKINNLHLEHVAFYNMGFAYSRMDNYKKAFEMYAQSFESAKKGKNLADEGDALYKMGLMKYYSEDFNESQKYLSEAMQDADSLNSNILRRNIYDVLYSLEESQGNYKKAYEYLNKYIDIEYEIFSEEDQQQVNYLQARFDAEKKEFQLNQLKAEKKIRELVLKKQQLLLIILGLLFALGITITFFIIRRYRYNQILAEQQAELQEQKITRLEKERQLVAAKSVLKGEEAERRRIAGDLHDGLGGLLSGLKINLSFMKENTILSGEQVNAFNNVLLLLDTSITELRRIAHNMMPESLLQYGLKTALDDFCSQVFSHGRPEIIFSFFGENIRFGYDLELTVYRISQELINNAVKYSNANRIDVQLFAEKERINLQVFDNGKGFDTEHYKAESEGKGLRNIEARVKAYGGNLEIISQPGQGTEIFVEFNLI
ncbi:MAG: hypothetical protein JW833_10180, partial [Prolixibacteraceae bacterium]|nr:hypothetical protein [Prolixibacteraceae bacterium]